MLCQSGDLIICKYTLFALLATIEFGAKSKTPFQKKKKKKSYVKTAVKCCFKLQISLTAGEGISCT